MGMTCYRDQLSFSCGEKKNSYKKKLSIELNQKVKHISGKRKKKKEFSTRKKAWTKIWKKVFIIRHFLWHFTAVLFV